MLSVIEWMMQMEEPPDHLMEEIEVALQLDVLDVGGDKTVATARKRMADIFNKLDPSLFENVSAQLARRIPEEFGEIRKRMFTFDDMARIGGQDIGRIMRGVSGNTVPLALKGAREELREHFFTALPARSRDMLVEELESMGPVRARDVRDAQNAMVDYALEIDGVRVFRGRRSAEATLSRQNVQQIELPVPIRWADLPEGEVEYRFSGSLGYTLPGIFVEALFDAGLYRPAVDFELEGTLDPSGLRSP